MKEFEHYKDRIRHQQEFDKDNITLTKKGKTYNVYQAIQEAREDTEIYPTLEKYGCIENMPKLNFTDLYGDFTEIQQIRSPFEATLRANQMWEALPLEIRKEFDNDVKKFTQNGEQWLKKKIEAEKKANYQEPAKTEPVKTENESEIGATNE